MTLETKTCGKCKLDLPLSSFYNRPERNGIQKFCCKECHKAAMKVYREANREKVKASQRRTVAKKREYYTAKARDGYHRRKAQGGKDWSEKKWAASILREYGLSSEDYYKMLSEQGGACAICRKPANHRLCVDHDHISGKVRALLCKTCNKGLGVFHDDHLLVQLAADYLARFK